MENEILSKVMDKVYLALQRFSYKGLEKRKDENGAEEILFFLKRNIQMNIKNSYGMAILRSDIEADGYSEDEILESSAKIAEVLEQKNISITKAIDGSHVTLMSIIQPEENDNEAERKIFNTVLTFCQDINENSYLFKSLEPSGTDEELNEQNEAEMSQFTSLFDELTEDLDNRTADLEQKEPEIDSVTNESESESGDIDLALLSVDDPGVDLNEILGKLAEREESMRLLASDSANDEDDSSDKGIPKKSRRKRKRRRKSSIQNKADVNLNSEEEIEDSQEDNQSSSESENEPIRLETENGIDVSNFSELEQLRTRLYAEAEERVNRANERLEARKSKLDAYQSTLEARSDELVEQQKRFNEEVETKRRDIDEYQKSSLAILEQRKTENLEQLQLAEEKQLEAFKKQGEIIAARQREVDYQKQQLKSDREELDARRAELDEDRVIFEKMRQESLSAPEFVYVRVENLENENETLKQRIAEYQSFDEKVESYKGQIANLEEQMKSMVSAELAAVTPEDFEKMQDETQKAQAECDNLLSMCRLQKKAIDGLKYELAREKRRSSEAESNNEKCDNYIAEIDELTQQLDDLANEVETLTSKNGKLVSEVAQAKNDLSVAVREKEHALQELEEAVANKSNGPRYSLQEVQDELSKIDITCSIKPANGQMFIVGEKNGCSINVNADSDFVYIEKTVKSTRKHTNRIAELNQRGGVTTNFWLGTDKVMCRLDYTLRPNCEYVQSRSLSTLIEEVCASFQDIK